MTDTLKNLAMMRNEIIRTVKSKIKYISSQQLAGIQLTIYVSRLRLALDTSKGPSAIPIVIPRQHAPGRLEAPI